MNKIEIDLCELLKVLLPSESLPDVLEYMDQLVGKYEKCFLTTSNMEVVHNA